MGFIGRSPWYEAGAGESFENESEARVIKVVPYEPTKKPDPIVRLAVREYDGLSSAICVVDEDGAVLKELLVISQNGVYRCGSATVPGIEFDAAGRINVRN